MKVLKSLFLTLAVVLCFATRAFSAISISSLPFNCTVPNEIYVVTQDLSLNAGNAITVSANNVTINGNGKTITYAVTGAGYGIFINTYVTSITSLEIYNLTITQGAYDPVAGERVHGIYTNGSFSGVKIHNNTININHSGGVADAFGYGIYFADFSNNPANIEIYSNTINMSGTSGGRGISFNTSVAVSLSALIYQNNIVASNLDSTPAGYPSAITILGSGTGINGSGVQIYENTVTVSSSCSRFQGIGAWAGNNMTVRSNTVNMGGLNSRALGLDGGSKNNKVFLNKVIVTSNNGPSENSSGLTIRFGASNNEIFRNTIDATGCTGNCFPIRLGGDEGNGIPANNIFHHNTLSSATRVISIEDATSGATFYGNSLINTDNASGYAIYLLRWVTGDVIENIRFSYESITGGRSTGKVSLADRSDGAIGVRGVTLCQSGLSASDLTVSASVADWSLTSSNCQSTPPSIPTW